MRRCLVWGLGFSLLLSCSVSAQERREGQKMSDPELIQKVSRLLRWTWYWETRPLENYVESKKTEMAIVESPGDIAAFLAEIGIYLVFDFDGNVIGGRGFPPTTNSAAVDKYIAEYRTAPDLKSKPEHEGEIISSNPAARGRQGEDTLTMEEKRKILKVRSIPFTLPKLRPPEAIFRRVKSPELPRLKAAVPAALENWYNPSCGEGEILIPYFSDDDQWVDVYADLGGCGKGIIYFTHHYEGGPWKFSPFWPNKPPDDFSSIIRKIRNNVADRMALPLPSPKPSQ